MPTDKEFKPCPFCGGTDIRCDNHGKVSRDPIHRDDDVWSMCCYGCGATFPNRYRRKLLVEAWNTRPVAGWQPIETAPTDGRRLWISDGETVWDITAHKDGSHRHAALCKYWMDAVWPEPPIVIDAKKDPPRLLSQGGLEKDDG